MPQPINGTNDNSNTTNPAGNGTPAEPAQGSEPKGDAKKTFTQEEVDAIVSKRVNELNAKNEEATKTAIKDALEDYDRKAKMTADEKAQAELDEQRKEVEKAKREVALRENRATARELLQEKGIDESSEILDFVVTEDEAETKKRVEAFAKSFDKSVEANVTKKLAKQTPVDPASAPRPSGGDKIKSTHELLYGK